MPVVFRLRCGDQSREARVVSRDQRLTPHKTSPPGAENHHPRASTHAGDVGGWGATVGSGQERDSLHPTR